MCNIGPVGELTEEQKRQIELRYQAYLLKKRKEFISKKIDNRLKRRKK